MKGDAKIKDFPTESERTAGNITFILQPYTPNQLTHTIDEKSLFKVDRSDVKRDASVHRNLGGPHLTYIDSAKVSLRDRDFLLRPGFSDRVARYLCHHTVTYNAGMLEHGSLSSSHPNANNVKNYMIEVYGKVYDAMVAQEMRNDVDPCDPSRPSVSGPSAKSMTSMGMGDYAVTFTVVLPNAHAYCRVPLSGASNQQTSEASNPATSDAEERRER